ncbi:MAG: aminotransferase class I/II-fold pyridoxal phosphate-dependent enzyme [Bacteroidaceae bacterium]|nr:aminotransferase class I/II-fold pyridoxal phosphate-dependent enzyme [Bacteroidaceae bacterium]
MIKGHGNDIYCYPEGVKMDFSSNICPHVSHHALMTHLAACGEKLLTHYPEPEAWSLEEMLAERLKISPRSVIVTNGATEAIYLIARTFGYCPHILTPAFQEYEDAYAHISSTHPEKTILWLCNPNNPMGKVYEQETIEKFCQQYDFVVIDQSYEHYTEKFVIPPRRMKMMNVIQLHSMTKTYAVPGLRLGYITAPVQLANCIRRHMHPWSVNAFAIEAGKFLLTHDEELHVCPDFNEVQRLWKALDSISELELLPTDTNFMLCRIKSDATAAELKAYLVKEHGILIRDASNFRGLTRHHFRVATQSPEENDALVAAITQFLQQR